MVRHRCAACGQAINRTDHLFEASDGTLCQDCQTRLAPGASRRECAPGSWDAHCRPWTALPELERYPHR